MVKGIGNGFPLVVVVTIPEIAQVLTQRSHYVIFGGNLVCTTGGHAVLKFLDKEKTTRKLCCCGCSSNQLFERTSRQI
jgi:4-aminobutyrate aminotransferase-like enzyme